MVPSAAYVAAPGAAGRWDALLVTRVELGLIDDRTHRIDGSGSRLAAMVQPPMLDPAPFPAAPQVHALLGSSVQVRSSKQLLRKISDDQLSGSLAPAPCGGAFHARSAPFGYSNRWDTTVGRPFAHGTLPAPARRAHEDARALREGSSHLLSQTATGNCKLD